jgi:D-alanyl-D-alanine carboxypeptidase/D-alanyl-D-alanine-endopeptidase (penicillin-binding protein 4)
VQRKQGENYFYLENTPRSNEIPFLTENNTTAITMLSELIQKRMTPGGVFDRNFKDTILHSQPTDSLLKPMMHRSDNFFAEQALLMVSNEVLGYMNDEKIIDTILKTDLADLPHRPRWADGSGLSRYNLFTPQDFVVILNKMKAEFGMARIRTVFASGGKGTLSNFYKADRPYLYAKTGTLSGVVALSGYLTTAKGKELIVSVLVNNHRSGAVQIRSLVERFLQNLRDRY